MKLKLLTLLLVSFFCISLKAQDSSLVANICSNFGSAFCSLDLRSSQFTIDSMVGADTVVYGMATMPADYEDVRYSLNNCGAGGSTICQTDPKISLYYQVYYPKKKGNININYNNCKFPALVLFHGGSYDECGSLYNAGVIFLANEYAKRGFVVFNVEYRRGVLVDDRTHTSAQGVEVRNIAVQQMLAIYRAGQDARGALRSIIKRQRRHSIEFSTDPYQIDTTKIFVGGISAGSVVALNAVYYQNQNMINQSFPGVINALGAIEQNYYYGDTTVEFAPYVKGVLNMWGALLVPYNRRNNPAVFFGDNSYMPPIISFCGKDDGTFYYKGTNIYFSPPGIYHGFNPGIETNCLLTSSYALPDNGDNVPDLFQMGSSDIYDMFKSHSLDAELYLDCTMEHGLDDDCVCEGEFTLDLKKNPEREDEDDPVCISCVFDSNFGTILTTSDEVNVYMASRGATFFQGAMGTNILNNLTITKFVECENFRHTCDTTNQNACPYNTVELQNEYDCTDWEQ